jgi:hypothetical protein
MSFQRQAMLASEREFNRSLSQLDQHSACAALIRWGLVEAINMRMTRQEICDRAAQRALAVSMNYAHALGSGQVRFVKELIHPVSRLIDSRADHVQLGRKTAV